MKEKERKRKRERERERDTGEVLEINHKISSLVLGDPVCWTGLSNVFEGDHVSGERLVESLLHHVILADLNTSLVDGGERRRARGEGKKHTVSMLLAKLVRASLYQKPPTWVLYLSQSGFFSYPSVHMVSRHFSSKVHLYTVK